MNPVNQDTRDLIHFCLEGLDERNRHREFARRHKNNRSMIIRIIREQNISRMVDVIFLLESLGISKDSFVYRDGFSTTNIQIYNLNMIFGPNGEMIGKNWSCRKTKKLLHFVQEEIAY